MKKHKQARHTRRKPTRADMSQKMRSKHYRIRALRIAQQKKLEKLEEMNRLERARESSSMKS